MVGELWVNTDTLDLPFPESFDPDDARARYKDLNTEACGTIAEIYCDLKPHLRSYLADPELRPSFKEHVGLNLFICRYPRLIGLHSFSNSLAKNAEIWCTWRVCMLPGYWASIPLFSTLTAQTIQGCENSSGTQCLQISIPLSRLSYFRISTLQLNRRSNLRYLQRFELFFPSVL